jgi:hypothetical protein
MGDHPAKPGLVIRTGAMLVEVVLYAVGQSNIRYAVVIPNPIDVVEFALRPVTVHIAPRKPMGKTSMPLHSAINVSGGMLGAHG